MEMIEERTFKKWKTDDLLVMNAAIRSNLVAEHNDAIDEITLLRSIVGAPGASLCNKCTRSRKYCHEHGEEYPDCHQEGEMQG